VRGGRRRPATDLRLRRAGRDCPADALADCLEGLADAGVEAAEIGAVQGLEGGEPELVLDGDSITEPIEDDLYPLWEAADTDD